MTIRKHLLRFLLDAIIIAGIAVIWISGCSSTPGPVATPYAAIHNYPSDGFQSNNVFRICFDPEGNPLPLPESGKAYLDPVRLAESDGLLSEYFTQPQYDPQAVFNEISKRINHHIRVNKIERPQIVIMIHGFNSTYYDSRQSYHWIRNSVERVHAATDTIFLEIYWDTWLDRSFFKRNWKQAGPLAKHIGRNSVRNLIKGIEQPSDIYLISFSRGAAVAVSTVWDTPYEDGETEAVQSLPATSLPNTALDRHHAYLGLVAPVVSVNDIRMSLLEKNNPHVTQVKRLVMTLKPKDQGIINGISRWDFLGNTWVGNNASNMNEIINMLQQATPAIEANALDFSGNHFTEKVLGHGHATHHLESYFAHPQFESQFLPLLFQHNSKQTP